VAVSTTSKSPKDILLTALSVGQAKLADYSHRNSPKKFTQPQLFACLVLKTSLGLDYRGLAGLLNDSADLCQVDWTGVSTALHDLSKGVTQTTHQLARTVTLG
jgi:hypothetical protein